MLRLATHAMGTRFELVLPLLGPGMGRGDGAQLRAAGEEALAAVQEWHSRLNRFAKDSELSFLNRAASERPVKVDEDVLGLLLLCRRVWEESGGAFDPTVAPMMDALRGDATERGCVPGFARVELDERARTVRFATSGVRLDLGGIAKGFALDHASAVLRACGVTSALMHGGTSSIVAIGSPPGRAGWTVAIESAGEAARCVLSDRHLSVSSTMARGMDERTGGGSHVVDPRDGKAVLEDRTAGVIAASGAVAEAWSTVLCVLGHRPKGLDAGVTTAVHGAAGMWRVEGVDEGCFEFAGAGASVLEVA